MVRGYPDILGEIVKTFRIRTELTIEAVAERAGITDRYLYRIENERKKTSFDVLCRLIRVFLFLRMPSFSQSGPCETPK